MFKLSKPVNVLIFSQHFWPESFRINEVAQSLRAAGVSVQALTGQPNYPDGKTFRGYRPWRLQVDSFDGIDVLRVPLVPRGEGGALRLVANYLSFILSASLFGPYLLRRRRVDAIFVYGTSPILQAIAALVVGKLKRAKVVIWVQDLWPESLVATGFVKNRVALSLVGHDVSWIYRHSDLLLVQSEAFAESVASISGGTPVRYHPNPGELSFKDPVVSDARVQLEPGFNILFAGNLGTVQALETVVEAAGRLADIPEVRFVLVGSGSRGSWLADEVARRGLLNVRLLGRFPPADMPSLLAQASALLVTLARSPILAQTVPSKVQAYLAAGKPIIASLDGEGGRVVEAAQAGIACPAEDPIALAVAVRKLYATPLAERERMGQAGRRFYEKHYDPEMLATELAALIGEVLASR
ncbi:MAG TPA: glycosyltransferase family 4 protein [Edaphobacter sp.]|nr:glycosyltransferase family 4 protein [Edaphobacter sp.]